VILRNLLHTGLKLVVSSVAFGTLVTVTGVSGGWTNWVFSSLFLSGLADMFIAGMFNYAALMSPGADSRVAVEVENGSFRIWVGDDAQEIRRRYLEDRERGAYGSWPPDSALRWRREAVRPLPAMRPPEKRLAGPLPRRSFPGIEFQESLAYVCHDRPQDEEITEGSVVIDETTGDAGRVARLHGDSSAWVKFPGAGRMGWGLLIPVGDLNLAADQSWEPEGGWGDE